MTEATPEPVEERASWEGRPLAERRLTVDQVRARCARLGPPGRRTRVANVEAPRWAGVMIPVTELKGEAAVVMTKRPATMAHHQNDWVFPGGGVDPSRDRGTRDTAVREISEELGAPLDRIEVIGQLTTHGPIITGFILDVYVGLIDLDDLAPDPSEVADWVVLPISQLTETGAYRRSGVMPKHDNGPRAAGATFAPDRILRTMPFFQVQPGEDLWGLQGDMMYEFLQSLFEPA